MRVKPAPTTDHQLLCSSWSIKPDVKSVRVIEQQIYIYICQRDIAQPHRNLTGLTGHEDGFASGAGARAMAGGRGLLPSPNADRCWEDQAITLEQKQPLAGSSLCQCVWVGGLIVTRFVI